jgi:hypothetical protein
MLPFAPARFRFSRDLLIPIRTAAVSAAFISAAIAQTALPQSLPRRTDADVPDFAPKMIECASSRTRIEALNRHPQ